MPKLEFTGQSARNSDNISANPSRLVNCYREPVASQGRTSYAIRSAPGSSLLTEAPGAVRALEDVSGTLYAVAGGNLCRVNSLGASILGAVVDDVDATISGNNSYVTVTAGGRYFTWGGSLLTEPAPGAFSAFGGHDYIANYTVLTEHGGRRFQWSDIADPRVLPGLNFATADGRDDNLIRPLAVNGVLYLFKETSHEIWYVTGGAGAEAFERQAGGVVDLGLKSARLLCRVQGGAFLVGDDNRAYLLSGGATPVSIPPVEVAIKNGGPMACFAYEDLGHTFCAITFLDRPAWVYDIATGEWHERAEDADLLPWRVACTAKARGVWYAGRGSRVLRFNDEPQDDEMPLVREITSRTLEIERKRFTVDLLEVFPRQGFNVQALELEVSRDGGLTWTVPKVANIGPIGAYGQRVTWRGLGQARQFTARMRASEADDFTIMADCDLAVR